MKKELIKVCKFKKIIGDSCILKDKDIILNSIRVYRINHIDEILDMTCFDICVGGSGDEFQIIVKDIPREYAIIYQVVVDGYKIDISAEDLPKYKNDGGNYTICFNDELKIINAGEITWDLQNNNILMKQ